MSWKYATQMLCIHGLVVTMMTELHLVFHEN